MVESSSFKSNSGLEHDTCHLHAPKWLYFCTFSTQNGHARYRPSHQTWAACAALRLKDLQLCNLWRQSSWWRRAVGAPMDECGEFFVAAPLSDMEAVSPWNLLVGRIYSVQPSGNHRPFAVQENPSTRLHSGWEYWVPAWTMLKHRVNPVCYGHYCLFYLTL